MERPLRRASCGAGAASFLIVALIDCRRGFIAINPGPFDPIIDLSTPQRMTRSSS
jgi:hypothetical protein